MTIQQALDRIDAIKPNMVMQEVKIQWLSEIDAVIQEEIINQHYDNGKPPHHHIHWPGNPLDQHIHHHHDHEGKKLEPYCTDGDMTQQLIVPFPYDKLYQHYLAMQLDIVNAEVEKYNNDSQLFNAAYMEFSDWYTRNHMPVQKNRQFRL